MEKTGNGKREYLPPKIEIFNLLFTDVITASKNSDENSGEWDFEQDELGL